MRVLVIGGTLFIGRLLVKDLLRKGYEVAVMHRRTQHDLGRRVENLAADRNDPEAVRQALAGRRFDAVFDNVYDWERGTTADQVEATALACGPVSRYVFMSSVAAYGDGLNHYENDPLAPDNHPIAYTRNKAMSERRLFRLWEKHRFPVVTFRPPFVYGPGNAFYREAFFWDRLRAGRPILIPGDGHRLMQFVFVKDLVAAAIRAIEVPTAAGQAFNIGNSRAVTQVEFVEALGKVAGRKPTLVRVPRESITQAGGNAMGEPMYFGEYLDLPPITEKVTKFPRVLGVEITPFEKGLQETYRWYTRNAARGDLDFPFEDRLLAAGKATRAQG